MAITKYEKLNLTNGTVLSEEHLAHIESGIVLAQEQSSVDISGRWYNGAFFSLNACNRDENFALGAGLTLYMVSYSPLQNGLTDAEKAQARTNIGAAAGDANGLILSSPNGTKFRISVSDNGTLSAAQVT